MCMVMVRGRESVRPGRRGRGRGGVEGPLFTGRGTADGGVAKARTRTQGRMEK